MRAARSVRRLHLRAESEVAVRRALPALEDAFRTATLPDAGARLMFVRRLTLGRLPRGASPQHLSVLLESRFLEAGWTLVHGAVAANDVEAVWFRDTNEAHEVAALRIASGRDVDAWYWPLAVPALAVETSPAGRLREIAFALAAREEAPAALRAWVVAMVRAGHAAQLIAALRTGDGLVLLQAAGMRQSVAAAMGRAPDRPRNDAASERAPETGRIRDLPDDRVDFVRRMLEGTAWHSTIAVTAPTAGDAGPPQESGSAGQTQRLDAAAIAAGPQSTVADSAEPGATVTSSARAASGSVSPPPAHFAPALVSSSQKDTLEFLAGPRSPASEPARDVPSGGGADREQGRPVREHSPWTMPHAGPTAAGGLLFIVPVLERVGFRQWYESLGADQARVTSCARQIFGALLSRLRIAEDDPAWHLAAPGGSFRLKAEATTGIVGVGRPRTLRSQAEDVQGSSRGFRLQAEGFAPDVWLTACRRWLRRRARIGLASLVVRPARLALTATHADVFFPLSGSDLRVRRAALDVDPGWVPWLGRVVGFHYEDRPWN